jgi:Flagellar hook-length control protein FliK
VDIIVSPTPSVAPVQNGPTPQSALPNGGLTPGDIVDARVLQVLADGRARIAVANTVIDVATNVLLQPGTLIKLAVSNSATGILLAIVDGGEGAVTPGPRTPAVPAPLDPNAVLSPATTGRPPTPAAALATAVQSAALRQGGLAPLLADIAALADAGTPLPAPVARAAAAVLALRVDGNVAVSADDVKQAFARSGTLLEAHLTAPPTLVPGAVPPASAPDLKAALVVLQQVLKTWIDGASDQASTGALPKIASPALAMSAAAPGEAPHAPIPPPYRGAPTVGQPPMPPSIDLDAGPRAIGSHLLAETDAAIGRQILLQAASLPDQSDLGARGSAPEARWNFEVPIQLPQGTAIAQFEIARDGHHQGDGETESGGPVWRARFSLDIEPMGAVHAQVVLMGARTAVTLWADRPASTDKLRANAGELAAALRGLDLEPGDVTIRQGEPPPVVAPPHAGHFLDRAT